MQLPSVMRISEPCEIKVAIVLYKNLNILQSFLSFFSYEQVHLADRYVMTYTCHKKIVNVAQKDAEDNYGNSCHKISLQFPHLRQEKCVYFCCSREHLHPHTHTQIPP
jgi:hypothetical protein